jgi:cbb3-type cytochrome oxidase maturation protein
MDILYLLVPLSVVLVFAIGFFFRWALKGGQFEDLEGPGYRILMDDDRPKAESAGVGAPPSVGSAPNEPKFDLDQESSGRT